MAQNSILTTLKTPLHVAALATGASSFRDNPIIGSPNLNRKGLHTSRIKLAERMGDARRRRLQHLLSREHREQFAEQGFVLVENALRMRRFAPFRKRWKPPSSRRAK